MFASHYDDWRNTRMNGILSFVGQRFIQGKSLLEMGCGFADVGDRFHRLGAKVTSSDAREEHLIEARRRYGHLTFRKIDAEKDQIGQKYDIIVHWGLLYHIDEIDKHLKDVCSNCDYLFLESEVVDSSDKDFSIKIREVGYDKAVHGIGIQPSWAMVEYQLSQNGFSFVRIRDPMLNSSFHHYNWAFTESKAQIMGQRSFWICWKTGLPSPLLG